MEFVHIKGTDNYYVNALGEVKGKSGKIMKPCLNKYNGYYQVNLRNNNKAIPKAIHRIVAETLLEPVEGKTHVNHIDGDKSNNRLGNLEWCTRSENQKHAYKMGLISREDIMIRGIKGGESARDKLGKRIKLVHRDGHTHVFDSIRQAAESLKLDRRTLQRVADKKKSYNSIQGYKVEVIERG